VAGCGGLEWYVVCGVWCRSWLRREVVVCVVRDSDDGWQHAERKKDQGFGVCGAELNHSSPAISVYQDI
jgi:hypothetical protein